ncbi:protein kinase [candidate division KSB1 bacterium]|nr:protein kinase [candidate division KSB1 bacterium]
MIGKTISHYKILKKLAEGGMGVIYKAEDLKLKRIVALKFLPPELTRDKKAKERFVHEAQAASALEHPNICNIHEIDEISIEGRNQMFICMAYYQGETLEKKIGRGPFKIDQAIDIARQISEGLARAHEAGIVHRDIKPANIMITDRGEVKILDFGLAKLRGRTKLTKTGTTLGTLAYMSPEQAKGEEMDHRSDIFSFGAVLYEMLTGLHAFKSEIEGAVVYSILNEEPEPMTGLRTGVPMELERIVNKALNKSEKERYQHMDEVLVDLKALTLKFRKDSGYRLEKVESLAVMPFSNTSGKEEVDYLSEGLTESLITSLSQISNFKVISRTSVFHYEGQQIEIQKVARELKVTKLLLGWVNQRADNVSIGVELVEGSDNSQIWGEQYTRKFTNVVKIQEEVVKDISTKLKLKLTRKEKKHLAKQYKVDNEAYQLFLKGRYHWNKRAPDSFKQSISFYNQAIEKDPAYALAYSGLSDSYALIGIYGYLPAKDVWPKAKAAALKALEIDPDMAEAHNALGAVESSYEWNWAKAEKTFQHSIALNPNYATAHHWYAGQLRILGKFDDSLREIHKAQELDPLHLQISTDVGRLHYYAREYDLAVKEYRKVLELDSNFYPAHLWLGLALLEKRDFGLAIESLQTALTLSGDFAAVAAALGYAFGISGKRTKAKKIMQELKSRAKNEYISAAYFAWMHVSLNELDAAFQYFDKAFEERSWWVVYLKIWPAPEEMTRDARYTKLLKKLGLPV